MNRTQKNDHWKIRTQARKRIETSPSTPNTHAQTLKHTKPNSLIQTQHTHTPTYIDAHTHERNIQHAVYLTSDSSKRKRFIYFRRNIAARHTQHIANTTAQEQAVMCYIGVIFRARLFISTILDLRSNSKPFNCDTT